MEKPSISESEWDTHQEVQPSQTQQPPPCPECGSTKGYSRMGKFRSQCLNCNSLLKNEEINREDLEPQ